MRHPCRYPTETVKEKKWGWDSTDRRDDGERHADVGTIPGCPGESGAGLCFVQYKLLTSRLYYLLNWEVLSNRSKVALPNAWVFHISISFRFHVPVSFTAELHPRGGCLSRVPQGSSLGPQR